MDQELNNEYKLKKFAALDEDKDDRKKIRDCITIIKGVKMIGS